MIKNVCVWMVVTYGTNPHNFRPPRYVFDTFPTFKTYSVTDGGDFNFGRESSDKNILVANYWERFPIVSLIAEIYVNVGLAYAEAERIFSDMNRVMTKFINSMEVTRMSKKIIISRVFSILTKEESENILMRALEMFLTLKNRRRGQGRLV